MLKENVKATGEVSLVLKDANGNLKKTVSANLIVNTGLEYLATRAIGTGDTVMTHIAVGSGAVAAAAANTTLGTELGRVALDSTTLVTTTATNDSAQFVATVGAGVGTGAVTEAGIFNAATNGTMLARSVFGVINKAADDILTITWKVAIA